MVAKQKEVSEIIDKNVKILTDKIKEKTPSCSNVKVVSVPSIFEDRLATVSLLPGSTNMLNLRGHLVIPDTYYRPFNLYIKKQLEMLGQKVFFVDDMELYHFLSGEIHCGTNVIREKDKYMRKIGVLEK